MPCACFKTEGEGDLLLILRFKNVSHFSSQ